MRTTLTAIFSAVLIAASPMGAWAQAAQHPTAVVSLPAAQSGPVAGRVLIFAEAWDKAVSDNHGVTPVSVDADEFFPNAVFVAAKEVEFAPGATDAVIDLDDMAFPAGFSTLSPGNYAVQAVLDIGHSYAYSGRSAADALSPVQEMTIGAGAAPWRLTLTPGTPVADPFALAANASPTTIALVQAQTPNIDRLDVSSPSLSAFWGRDVHMQGFVVRPPGYDTKSASRYPTVYWTHGFGGSLSDLARSAARLSADMQSGSLPPMIVVLLYQGSATGTHEFADSVNNGPWGTALTTELIPGLEQRYRMDNQASGRFVTGHSSGGWATLWLITRYPKVFGGAWATSPDSSDFHDFTGADLYAANANVYHHADGTVIPLVRDHAKVLGTFETFAKEEAVLGAYGGQMSSFDWVFSPRGPDGRPLPMFNRQTGDVNPTVVAYWRDHFDISYRVARDWETLKPDLDGKLHLIVGDADTFYLDGGAHRLQQTFASLAAKAEFTFLPDRTHFDLYKIGDDQRGLEKQIYWSMYRIARPHSPLLAGKPGQ